VRDRVDARGAFQLGHMGGATRCDVAVEDHTKFGAGGPSRRAQAMPMPFAKKGQPGRQLYHKAGFDTLGQDQVHKPTNQG